MDNGLIHITDPTGAGKAAPGRLSRFGLAFIRDERDAPFLSLMAAATAVMVPFAVWLYLPGRFRWSLAAVYLGVNFFVFLDRYILLLHNTSHRVLFRKEYDWLNRYVSWVLGPLFGESPETYFSHHLGMHHPENNLEDDLSSTMRFQRDRFDHFLRYLLRFFFCAMVECSVYLYKHRRASMARRLLAGELIFLSTVGLLWAVNPRATLVVFVIPAVVVRCLMMAGNWGQHSFIDPSRPESNYANSITCINTRYNRRCFNDGYHIGHHLAPHRHWTELPGDFESNAATYAREGALVFVGIDFFQVWLFLMLRRYDWLARHHLSLDGRARPHAEIVALLRSRTRAIVRVPA